MKFDFLQFGRVKESWEYRSEPENLYFLGEALWRMLLALLLIALLLCAWLGVEELSAVNEAQNPKTASSSAPPPLDPAKLRATLTGFSSRAVDYQTLTASAAPQVADPSK